MSSEKIKNGEMHTGDCLAVMRTLESGSVRLVVTSPPYNLRSFGKVGTNLWRGRLADSGYDGHSDDMPEEDYIAWQRDVLRECWRLLDDCGAIYYNTKWLIRKKILRMRMEILGDLPLRQIIIWNQGGSPDCAMDRYGTAYEVIYLIAKPDWGLRHGAKVSAVWTIGNSRRGMERAHPAEFPVQIPMRCLDSQPPNVVLDPFMGGGTTAVAAEKMGWKWIGIEQSPKYVDIARQRIEAVTPGLLTAGAPSMHKKRPFKKKGSA